MVTGMARRHGFTLIELLVVMAAVSLLLGLVVPRYFEHLERAREAALRQNLATFRDALDKFSADRGHWPAELDELVAAGYLRAIPTDPYTERNDTWQLVEPVDGRRGRISDIRSGAPGSGRQGAPYGSL